MRILVPAAVLAAVAAPALAHADTFVGVTGNTTTDNLRITMTLRARVGDGVLEDGILHVVGTPLETATRRYDISDANFGAGFSADVRLFDSLPFGATFFLDTAITNPLPADVTFVEPYAGVSNATWPALQGTTFVELGGMYGGAVFTLMLTLDDTGRVAMTTTGELTLRNTISTGGYGYQRVPVPTTFTPASTFTAPTEVRLDGDAPASRSAGRLRGIAVPNGQALLQFTDLFGSAPGQLPPGTAVGAATLHVAQDGAALHPVLQPVDLTTITYATAQLGGNTLPGLQADGIELGAAGSEMKLAPRAGVFQARLEVAPEAAPDVSASRWLEFSYRLLGSDETLQTNGFAELPVPYEPTDTNPFPTVRCGYLAELDGATWRSRAAMLDVYPESVTFRIGLPITPGVPADGFECARVEPTDAASLGFVRMVDVTSDVAAWSATGAHHGWALLPSNPSPALAGTPPTRLTVAFTPPTAITPTVTWDTPSDLVAGAALSGAELDAMPSEPGQVVYTPPLGTVLAVGTHTLHVDFIPTDRYHVRRASAEVTLRVVDPCTSCADAGVTDAGATDAGLDASLVDMGVPDAGASDAGVSTDGGIVPDLGSLDGGTTTDAGVFEDGGLRASGRGGCNAAGGPEGGAPLALSVLAWIGARLRRRRAADRHASNDASGTRPTR